MGQALRYTLSCKVQLCSRNSSGEELSSRIPSWRQSGDRRIQSAGIQPPSDTVSGNPVTVGLPSDYRRMPSDTVGFTFTEKTRWFCTTVGYRRITVGYRRIPSETVGYHHVQQGAGSCWFAQLGHPVKGYLPHLNLDAGFAAYVKVRTSSTVLQKKLCI